MIKLSHSVFKGPDLSIGYFVQEGLLFSVEAYARAYNLNVRDIDPDDAKAAADASARLCADEWLEVSFHMPDDEQDN